MVMKKFLILIVASVLLMCTECCQASANSPERYKLYPTENIGIFLKLDSATGKIWIVQYGVGDRQRLVVPLDDTSLLAPGVNEVPGRYELYPTKNMFNFILLDTRNGNTYQVQWSTEPDERMRIRIE